MRTQDLNSLKLDFIRDFLMESDERVVMEAITSFRNAMDMKDCPEKIPGLPYTYEERMSDLRESEEDYNAGRVVTIEELRAKYKRK